MLACMLTPEEREQKRISREIERQLAQDDKKMRKEMKLLLLGAGESGKSTFIKQMRIIHGKGYSKDELLGFRQLIHSNVVTGMQALLEGTQQLNIPLPQDMKRSGRLVEAVDHKDISLISVEQYQAIKSLWQDPAIAKAYERRREFHLSDSAKYYLDSLDRVCAEGYVPTEQDILRARLATCGIHEYIFKISNASFRMVDVGGQRSERRKWIHAFESVIAVVFLVASSEYDQTLRLEEAGGEVVNRLQESCALFHTILTYPWFRHAAIILFLNKKDLLEEKIKTSHLADYFPEFDGEKGDYYEARRFISTMLIDSVPERSKDIYPHYTCATDTENMRVVFDQVRNFILERHLAMMQL